MCGAGEREQDVKEPDRSRNLQVYDCAEHMGNRRRKYNGSA